MTRIQLALYKGPPKDDWVHTLSHYGIRVWTWSRWSHAELVIDGVCWAASARDGGVRPKVIDLTSGRWDVFHMDLPPEVVGKASAWFLLHQGAGYDYRGIGGFIFRPLGHDEDRYECFESIGEALGLVGTHKLTANDLHRFALQHPVILNTGAIDF